MGTTRRQRISERRRRRVARADNDLTPAEWHGLVAAWGGCAYCGATTDDLQRDCVLAISRGGRYTVDNVVPACRSCNASKCNSEVTGWMRRKRLDERTFLVRQYEIVAALTSEHPPDEHPPSPGPAPADGDQGGIRRRARTRGTTQIAVIRPAPTNGKP